MSAELEPQPPRPATRRSRRRLPGVRRHLLHQAVATWRAWTGKP